MQIVKGKIGNALTSMAADHVVATAEDIFDERLSEYQSVLNELTIVKDEKGEKHENPFRYVANEEYIFAILDKDGIFLGGIHWDGTPQFTRLEELTLREFNKVSIEADDNFKAVNEQIKILSDRISTIIGDADQTNVIDTLNEMKIFFSDISNTEKLTSILKLIDKIAIHDEEGNVVESPFSVVNNNEFVKAIIDIDGRLLFGIRVDGSPYYPKNDMYNVVSNREYLYAIIDERGNLLFGINRDGDIVEGRLPLKTREELTKVKVELRRNVLSVEMNRDTGRIIGHIGNDSSISSCVQDRVTGKIMLNQLIE